MTARTTRPSTTRPHSTQPDSELPDQSAGFTGHTGDAR